MESPDRYRFYVPSLQKGPIALGEDQAHHALHVLRLTPETPVELFDGQGTSAEAVLTAVSKKGVIATAGEVRSEPRQGVFLTLATAVPKGERAEWLIEQVSQLEAGRVQFLDCQRGVVKPKEGGGKIEKWRRLAIESAKQCGRNWLLEVEPLQSLEAVLAEARGRGETVWWLEPRAGAPVGEAVGGLKQGGRVCALIGPEGGWSEREMDLLEKAEGVVRVRLTRTILRIETACAAVAAAVGGRNAER